MRLIVDAGALLAIERGDRGVAALIRDARGHGIVMVTHGGVVGQVWRGGARQARLALALRLIEVVPLGLALGRDSGVLLALTNSSDVVDAALVALAEDGDSVLTSDPDDIARLLEAAGTWAEVLPV